MLLVTRARPCPRSCRPDRERVRNEEDHPPSWVVPDKHNQNVWNFIGDNKPYNHGHQNSKATVCAWARRRSPAQGTVKKQTSKQRKRSKVATDQRSSITTRGDKTCSSSTKSCRNPGKSPFSSLSRNPTVVKTFSPSLLY